MSNQKLSLKNLNDLTVKECFEEYIDKCSLKNLSAETIKLYRNQFNVFLRTLDNPDKLISEITIRDIEHFILEERKNPNCNEITINSYLRGVRAFLYYAMEENYTTSFKITIPKVTKKIKETYLDRENEYPIRFINRSLESFLEFIVIIIKYEDELKESDDDEIIKVMQKIRKEFDEIDIQALSSDENWWSIILEQLELGVM